MKKFLPLLLFSLLSTAQFAQLCDSLNSPCVSTFSRNGYFFDLQAVNTVEIQGFSYMAQNPGTRSIEVYYKAGTYFGNETNSSVWSLLGTYNNVTPLNGTSCPLPLNPITFATTVCIPQGQTYGFYFQMTSGVGTIESHSTLTEGSIGAQDANLRLITGKGQFQIGPAFTGPLTASLTFQGVVQYACTCQTFSNSETISTSEIQIYPIPASSEIVISAGDHSGTMASIMDATGRVVMTEWALTTGENAVSIRSLASGVYFLRLKDAQGTISFLRFIKA